MTDIQKERQQVAPLYRGLAPSEKEAFKALAAMFVFMYKSMRCNAQQEKKREETL